VCSHVSSPVLDYVVETRVFVGLANQLKCMCVHIYDKRASISICVQANGKFQEHIHTDRCTHLAVLTKAKHSVYLPSLNNSLVLAIVINLKCKTKYKETF